MRLAATMAAMKKAIPNKISEYTSKTVSPPTLSTYSGVAAERELLLANFRNNKDDDEGEVEEEDVVDVMTVVEDIKEDVMLEKASRILLMLAVTVVVISERNRFE